MSLEQLRKRLVKVGAQVDPKGDGSFTYEELCRSIWQHDRKAYRKLVEQDCMLGLFVPQFEREDAEAWQQRPHVRAIACGSTRRK